MASNPVFDRIEKESRQGYAGFGRSGAPAQQPTAGMASTDGMTSQQLQDLYNQPAAGPVQTKRLTIDDVVMKTAGLFAIVLVFGVVGWQLSPTFGIGGTGALGIGISLLAIGLASAMLAVDFDSIDRAIAAGAPEKYSWLLAHGLIVTLVWLYLEILRLLGRLRSN